MIIPGFSSNGFGIKLREGLPENYRGFLLNTQTWFSENEYGLVIVQSTQVEGKWLRYIKVKAAARITMSFEDYNGYLKLLINLQSAFRFNKQGIFKSWLRQFQSLLKYAGRRKETIDFKAGKEYEMIEIWYPAASLSDYQQAFSFLDNLNMNIQWMTTSLIEVAKKIIVNAYTEDLQLLYYSVTLPRLLFELLDQHKNAKKFTALDWEIEAVNRAKAIIEADTKKFPGLKAIAKQVSLSEYKLKLLLKDHFDKTAFDIYMDAKIEKAYEKVVTTNLSIKVIAIEAGYKWSLNFATAFRKRYGEAPEILRKKLFNRNT